MVNNRKNRKNSRRNRKSRRNNNMSMRRRRNNINMMGGEYSMPAPVGDDSLRGPSNMSLAQGQQYASFHANQHGGALSGGPYPGVVTEEALISPQMAISARTAPLNAALNEIRGMSDQAGGFIPIRSFGKRKNRKNTMRKGRKGRKNTRKNRRNNMSMRKNRRNNMSMRKNRRNNNMSMRRRRNNMMGGSAMAVKPKPKPLPIPPGCTRRPNGKLNCVVKPINNKMEGGSVLAPAATSAPGLLLPSGLEAKAVSGMNAEWKLAENPRAFAPGL